MSIDIQINKSNIYFAPLFNEEVPILYAKNLMNTYFWYDDQNEDTFCLLYKFSGEITGGFHSRKGFTVYEKKLTEHKLFKGYRDYGEYVIYEFDLTDELIKKKHILLMGAYSNFSKDDKKNIISYNRRIHGSVVGHKVDMILHKDKAFMEDLAHKYKVRVDILPEGSTVLNPEMELFANYIRGEEEEGGIDEAE
tara:strand:+ start:1605 stop:2186 length:582 start_codon:yes stop_codon:yes gene_type:complete